MTTDLDSREDIIAALRNRMRVGEGLSMPYARKWAIGGCEASHSLWSYPHDAIADFADALMKLGMHARAEDDAISVNAGSATVWVAANGKNRNSARASEFLLWCSEGSSPVVVVNSHEVVTELIKAYGSPPEPIPSTEIVQVGFPGIRDDIRTYVGSWQWNVHGEAKGEEFVCRTANATLAAIRAKEAECGD
jgi:hypothetical protein